MDLPTRKKLAEKAEELAVLPFHGTCGETPSNLAPLVAPFPKWNVEAAENSWCAAFVYFCCMKAGFSIPYSPDECVTCSLAGCGGWEEFAMGDPRIEYHRTGGFLPERGDIVLFDRVFCGMEHDHIGIVLAVSADTITTVERLVGPENRSGIVTRRRDDHIRAYIRLPDGFIYR